MLNNCRNCEHYNPAKVISDDGLTMKCPKCGAVNDIKRLPLFLITGASGVGKSTIAAELFRNEKDYIVIEGDILWNQVYNTPEDDYRKYRELQLRLCKNISQGGKPVVLCGCSVPNQFEKCIESRYFSSFHYIAITCEDKVLEKRLRDKRNITDENWIKSSIEFNKWLKGNAEKTNPKIHLLDTSTKPLHESCKLVDEWLMSIISSITK